MNILGLSAGYHDAAATVISPRGKILFAAHSERYSRIKNHAELSPQLLAEAMSHGVSTVAWYERPWLHNLQQIRSGQMQLSPWTLDSVLKQHMGQFYSAELKKHSWPHHLSHAAAGFQTSPFSEAAVVVIDAIGELDTISIYRACYDDQGRAQYRRLWHQTYPHSIGLFYSAITKQVGLRPQEEEYITMALAAYGSPAGAPGLERSLLKDPQQIKFHKNLHRGFDQEALAHWAAADLAAASQEITEQMIMTVMLKANQLVGSDNLVYMGGVALNCQANRRLGSLFSHIWIMPNPGDAGSSLGAAALCYGGAVQWRGPMLGHCIEGPYPVQQLITALEQDHMAAVASGAAEFGPRALGNRSILARADSPEMASQLNSIKGREQYRPFGCAILEEFADSVFVMPPAWQRSAYMQTVARFRTVGQWQAAEHRDGTSRVQTVGRDGSGLRTVLEQWYQKTQQPLLINTSLNLRGEPLVNSAEDRERISKQMGIKVF